MKKEGTGSGRMLYPFILICLIGSIGLCVTIGIMLFRKGTGDEKIGIEAEKTPSDNRVVTQAVEPDAVGGGEEVMPVLLGTRDEVQREILELFFNQDVRYGMEYGNGVLTSEGFLNAFYEGHGAEIGMYGVGIGDCAVGDGVTGICVGFYDGVPVYAYMSEYVACGMVANGVCLGYSRKQKDGLFFGMYPVSFDTYYRGAAGALVEDVFPKYIELIPKEPWYADLVYDYGRWMSEVSTDYLMDNILHERLSADNQKLNKDSFEKFLRNLPSKQGFEGDYYLFIESVREGESYAEVEVKFIPCDTHMMKPVGNWKMTLYPDYQKFLPCGVNYKAYPEVGFVRESSVTVTEEDGEIKIEKEELIYGQTVDEEGNRIYRLDDGTVIHLD